MLKKHKGMSPKMSTKVGCGGVYIIIWRARTYTFIWHSLDLVSVHRITDEASFFFFSTSSKAICCALHFHILCICLLPCFGLLFLNFKSIDLYPFYLICDLKLALVGLHLCLIKIDGNLNFVMSQQNVVQTWEFIMHGNDIKLLNPTLIQLQRS